MTQTMPRQEPASKRSSWLRWPLTHFLALGALLWVFQTLTASPPRETITISAARVEQLRADWASEKGEPPSAQDESRLLAAEIDEEILLIHALDQELYRHMPAARSRLLSLMRFLYPDSAGSDEELLAQSLELAFHRRDPMARDNLLTAARASLEAIAPIADPTDQEVEDFLQSQPRGDQFLEGSDPEMRRKGSQLWQAHQRRSWVDEELKKRRELFQIHIEAPTPSLAASSASPSP
ncbi:MAG: hypothetical protein K0U98_15200 [Deltaproteobacteria bacterium]|nr:hypothetical protein [Deltaproteobacteria bacterium]